jgi:hypothetical protein
MARGTVDSSLIKQGYAKVAYTPETLRDFKNCAEPDTGALYFMVNHMRIQHPTRGGIDFEPFDYQLDLIENYNNNRFSINMLGRQMGKTTVAAGYLLWFAMFKPDSTILVAAHKQSGASEIMQRVRYAYECAPDHIRAGVTEYNKGSITFDNGSRIVSTTTTENTGRGMSLTLIYLDEFAFVPPRIAKEFWASLSPTLATGGRAIITSTPNSDDDTFATIWKQANRTFDDSGEEKDVGTNGFKHLLATWSEHPERDDAWAYEERSRIGEERFRREHECEFVIYDETLISPLKLLELEGADPLIRMGQVRWYKHPSPECMYCVSLDPSAGTGGDNAAIQVLELPTMIQVGEWSSNKVPIEGQVKVMMEIMQYIKECSGYQIYWTVENNSIGEAALVVIRDTGEENFPGEMLHEPRKIQGKKGRKGFHTTHKSKMESCLVLKRLVENDKIHIKSKALISELKNFVARGNSFGGKPGEFDDLVMSLTLGIRMVEFISTFEDDVYNVINSSLGLSDMDWMTGDNDADEPMPISII